MDERIIVRNRMKELRSRLELRQADLAREIGVTRQTILAIEKGRLNPSINIALKAARVLREPVDYVFYLEHRLEDHVDEPAPAKPSRYRPSSEMEPRAVWDFSNT